MDDEGRTTPLGLYGYAHSYFCAAIALRNIPLRKYGAIHPYAPIYFLYYHAIELYLKAFLRAHNVSVEDLSKKYKHSILKIHGKTKELGLEFDDEDNAIALMSETDNVISTRYIRTGFKRFPTDEALYRTCRRLHDVIGKELQNLGLTKRLLEVRGD